MVIAPRHLERVDELEKDAQRLGLEVARRSRNEAADALMLLNTMGELASFFSAGDLVFLGGTLVPVGGHNILEPAAAGLPVLVGPQTWTVQTHVDELELEGAAFRVDGMKTLSATVLRLARDETLRRAAGESAQRCVDRHRGATERTVCRLNELMTGSEAVEPIPAATVEESEE